MFWSILILWLISTFVCWAIFALCNEFDAKWCHILCQYEPYDIAIMTLPIINVLFLLFVFCSSIWKLIKLSFFNKKFYTSVKDIIEKIWES